MFMTPMAMMMGQVGAVTTWNPLDKTAGITLSNGNRSATATTANGEGVRGTTSKNSNGVWQFELTTGGGWGGIVVATQELAFPPSNTSNTTAAVLSNGRIYAPGGTEAVFPGGGNIPNGTILGVVLTINGATRAVSFYRNGQQAGPFDLLNMSGSIFPFLHLTGSGQSWSLNTGQNPFAYPVAGAIPWG